MPNLSQKENRVRTRNENVPLTLSKFDLEVRCGSWFTAHIIWDSKGKVTMSEGWWYTSVTVKQKKSVPKSLEDIKATQLVQW